MTVHIPEIVWDPKSVFIEGHHDDQFARLLTQPFPEGIGDLVRFDHSREMWLVWDGIRWAPDHSKTRYSLLRDRIHDWLIQCEGYKDAIRNISYVMDVSKQDNVFKSLSTMEPVSASGEEFDRDPYLLGVKNGTVDLRTMEMVPSVKENLITMSADADYNPDAKCPMFLEFLAQVTGYNKKMVDYLLLILGASLIGTTEAEQFYVLIGGGNNGKGVLCRTTGIVFGDYAIAPSRMLYMKSKYGEAASSAPRPDLLALRNKRFAHMSEPTGGNFNEDILKEHTGRDLIHARDLYDKSRGMVTFMPTHTIFFRTNDPPKLEDIGISMRRRLRAIPFRQDFSQNPDFSLDDKLRAEAEGILALYVRYAALYLSDPSAINDLPEEVREASQEYIEDSDPLSAFIRDTCIVRAGKTETTKMLYAAYQRWVEGQEDESLLPISLTAFGKTLGKRFTKINNRPATYAGLALNTQSESVWVEVEEEMEAIS